MEDTFTEFWNRVPIKVAIPLVAIHDAETFRSLPRADVTGMPAVTCWGVNDEHNARLPVALSWPSEGNVHPTVRWRVPISGESAPVELLYAADRLVLQGRGSWSLFDSSGAMITTRSFFLSSVVLDPRRAVLVAGARSGLLESWRLGDGNKASSIELLYGKNYDRSFIASRGGKMVIMSEETDVDVHAVPTEKSIIEVVDLEQAEPGVVKDLIRERDPMQAAMHEDTIVLVAANRIYILNLDLEFRQALAGDFQPLAFSLDEKGRIYLMARKGTNVSLWLITPDGERLWSFPVPQECAFLLLPPVVGYDHAVYLVSEGHLLSLGPDGKLRWQRSAAGRIVGAIVTADDRLVTSEGSQLAAWDAEGKRQVLFDFGEGLATPPVLTAGGDLIVASDTHLFCIARAH